jgi:NADH:ubiquinone oxidoreductase subunit 5 (subunit L)/multisubunit Na+/H+ antiporter MnhA subunit
MNAWPALVVLAPLLPFLAAMAIAGLMLSGRAAGDAAERPSAWLAEGCAWLAALLLLVLDALAFAEGLPGSVAAGEWFASGGVRVGLSFILDGRSLPFATLIALVGAIALRFSRNYLHREAGFHRFLAAMLLFLCGMLLIALAGNTVLCFVGWEFAGIASWLLIGYSLERPEATGNALQAFVTNRIGDAGLVLGIALMALWLGTVEWSGLDAWAQGSGFDRITARLILLGFLVAAVAKSAQLPFAAWISRALEGPTPSSAIFYGALLVHAGVYLVLRLEPVLRQTPDVMVYLAVAGAGTALYGWLAGLVQADVKSSLMFATTTQVGLMFLACGLGWFDLAAWHMWLHIAWRARQFLLAPSYMHLVSAKAPPAPAWLAGQQRLHAAALQRFWLEHLAQGALVRPLRDLGRDLRRFDDKVLAPLVGMPGGDDRGERVIRARGAAGALLAWTAGRLHRFESRLLARRGGGFGVRLLRGLGARFLVVEELLERPLYLLIAILATFVVIL